MNWECSTLTVERITSVCGLYTGEPGRNFFSQPNTPEVNTVAEGAHPVIGEVVRSMHIEASLLKWFWPFVGRHFVFVKNGIFHSQSSAFHYRIFLWKTSLSQRLSGVWMPSLHSKPANAFSLTLSWVEKGFFSKSMEPGVDKVLVKRNDSDFTTFTPQHGTFNESNMQGPRAWYNHG